MNPLPPTLVDLYCQTCGTSWLKSDNNTAHYFRSASFAIGDYASPSAINALGEEMTFCPACDTGQLEDAYKVPLAGIKESPFHLGDSRMVGETEADVNTRQAELDQATADADQTHR